nr:MAG: hypothetical protein DIU78_22250 [Pseudomonadota bacterium]
MARDSTENVGMEREPLARSHFPEVLFAHWPVPVAMVRPLVPPELEVQERDGARRHRLESGARREAGFCPMTRGQRGRAEARCGAALPLARGSLRGGLGRSRLFRGGRRRRLLRGGRLFRGLAHVRDAVLGHVLRDAGAALRGALLVEVDLLLGLGRLAHLDHFLAHDFVTVRAVGGHLGLGVFHGLGLVALERQDAPRAIALHHLGAALNHEAPGKPEYGKRYQ